MERKLPLGVQDYLLKIEPVDLIKIYEVNRVKSVITVDEHILYWLCVVIIIIVIIIIIITIIIIIIIIIIVPISNFHSVYKCGS